MKRTNEPLERLEGCYTALITPMKKGDGLNNEVDFDKLFLLVEDQIAAGVAGLVVAGTTGQSATLGHKEQVDLIGKVFDYVGGRTRIIASAGSNCTREAINLTRAIEDRIGPSTLLHVTGYYNNPPQAGLFDHYTALSRAVKGNIVLYNVPGRTRSNIDVDTVVRLADDPNIIGLKEASGDLDQVKKIIDCTNPDYFRVVSGEDHLVAKIMEVGGFGVISASANVAPKMFVEMVNHSESRNFDKATEIQERLLPLVKNAVFAAKNPIPLAYMFGTELRLPLCSLEKAFSRLPVQVDMVLALYNHAELGVDLAKYKR